MGFDVKRVETYGTFVAPFESAWAMTSTHNILIVKIDDKQYLVDIGNGYNSPRFPIEFIPETTREIVMNETEKYLIEFKGNHYNLAVEIKGGWFNFYGFDYPLVYINH